MRLPLQSRSLLLPAGIVWATAVAFGSASLLNYRSTPGAAGKPSRSWPAASGILPDRRLPTLVMVAHPHCPCTRASIEELARVLTRARKRVAAYVLFYRPERFPRGWERTDLWGRAAALPGVTPLPDPEGRTARLFGAVTSGHVFLYDSRERLLFSGGITGSRGHQGDNDGRDSVIRLLAGREGARPQAFVYGCPIRTGRVGSGK